MVRVRIGFWGRGNQFRGDIMYTQRQMGTAKKEVDQANSRMKRLGLKNAYVTVIRGQGPGALLVDRDKRHKDPTNEELSNDFHTEDFKKRQDVHRKEETKNERKVKR